MAFVISRPDVSPTDRLSISQFSRALGPCRQTIASWWKKGFIQAVGYDIHLNPVFSGKDLLDIWEGNRKNKRVKFW